MGPPGTADKGGGTVLILLYVVLGGLLLDLILGDPYWMPHPVVYIGKLIAALEKGLRQIFPATPEGERVAGIVLALMVLAVTGGVSWGLLYLLYRIHPALALVLSLFWCYQIPAARCLWTEAVKVRKALETGSLAEARTAIGYLVGRDTENLTAEGVTKAAVETVAENTTDGLVAPLFYLMIGGPVLGLLYKATNTMDSMIGYRNERYRYFGTAGARLDDVLNYIPARLTALLMVPAAALCGLSGKNAFRIWKRDRRKHKSPNSAQTESACAGALGVELAGDAVYFGELHHKPTIGDKTRPIEPRDIDRTCRLMVVTYLLAAVLFSAIRIAILTLI